MPSCYQRIAGAQASPSASLGRGKKKERKQADTEENRPVLLNAASQNTHKEKKNISKSDNTNYACVNLGFLQEMPLNAEKQRFCSCTRYSVVNRQASYMREMCRTHL
jgi:hypothetical protein